MDSSKIFLDTMIFLHYQSVDLIDWANLLKTKKVAIFLPPIVIRELEGKKNFSESKKIRKKASSALKKLNSFMEKGKDGKIEIRPGVELFFIPKDSTINFSGYNLNKDISDDHLLASIIDHRYLIGDNISLVTSDLSLKIKAIFHKIDVIELPEKYKLPEEIDPNENRVKELEKEISHLRNRIPKLKLCFEDGKDYKNIKLNENNYIDYENEDLNEILANYGDSYLEAYKKYLGELDQYNKLMAHTIKLNILIKNYGTAPASDIDVFLTFRGPIGVFYEDDMPNKPSKPNVPSRRDFFFPNLERENLVNMLNLDLKHTIFDNVSSTDIIRNDNYSLARIHLKKLKQNILESFDSIYIIFRSKNDLIPFKIEYKINEESSPIEIHGELNINIID